MNAAGISVSGTILTNALSATNINVGSLGVIITGGGLTTTGTISAAGLTVSGSITAGALTTTGGISAGAAGIISAGGISATGTVNAAGISVSGTILANSLSVTDINVGSLGIVITGGGLTTTGTISAAGLTVSGSLTAGSITVTGDINATHIYGTTATPTGVVGTGGSSGTGTIIGSDLGGSIQVATSATNPVASVTVINVTFARPFGTAPRAIILTPANSAAALLTGVTQVFVNAAATSTTSFVITAGTTRLTGSTTYKWYYVVIQ